MSSEIDNSCTKGHQGKSCKLEKLLSERNPHNGQAPERAKSEMAESHGETKQDEAR